MTTVGSFQSNYTLILWDRNWFDAAGSWVNNPWTDCSLHLIPYNSMEVHIIIPTSTIKKKKKWREYASTKNSWWFFWPWRLDFLRKSLRGIHFSLHEKSKESLCRVDAQRPGTGYGTAKQLSQLFWLCKQQCRYPFMQLLEVLMSWKIFPRENYTGTDSGAERTVSLFPMMPRFSRWKVPVHSGILIRRLPMMRQTMIVSAGWCRRRIIRWIISIAKRERAGHRFLSSGYNNIANDIARINNLHLDNKALINQQIIDSFQNQSTLAYLRQNPHEWIWNWSVPGFWRVMLYLRRLLTKSVQ